MEQQDSLLERALWALAMYEGGGGDDGADTNARVAKMLFTIAQDETCAGAVALFQSPFYATVLAEVTSRAQTPLGKTCCMGALARLKAAGRQLAPLRRDGGWRQEQQRGKKDRVMAGFRDFGFLGEGGCPPVEC